MTTLEFLKVYDYFRVSEGHSMTTLEFLKVCDYFRVSEGV